MYRVREICKAPSGVPLDIDHSPDETYLKTQCKTNELAAYGILR